VQDARRWVADLCTKIGRPELSECAQLGVSELVTNALLHGEPPINVVLPYKKVEAATSPS